MNPAIARVEGSYIRALHARKRPSSIDLGLGQPTLKPKSEYFERAARWVGEHGCGYSSNIGDLDLREAIAHHYNYPGLNVAANVCVTTGSQEAVYLVMKTLLDPAQDEVLVVEPAFMVYAKIAKVEGVALKIVGMPAQTHFALDADRILEALGPRTRMIVLCSPANPTGRVISNVGVKKIAAALLARPGPPVYVVHDEIYRELMFTADAGNFGDHYPYTIAINSLSKSNAMPGIRLGWAIAPADAVPALGKVHGWLSSCASTYAQRVAYDIFASDDLAGHRQWYADQRVAALAAAREHGLEAVEPEGAFYVCLNVGVRDGRRFAEALIDECDVVAVPGEAFGSTMAGWLRTSFVAPADRIREGYARIAACAPKFRESEMSVATP